MAIVAVSVRTGSKRLSGIAVAFPVTIKTVIVSPIALPNPKIQAAIIPEPAAGNTTFNMLTHLFPPKAYDASLNDWGTDRKASSETLTIVGKDIKAKRIAPLSALKPLLSPNVLAINGPIKTIPIKPMATDGTPANISIIGFMIPLSLRDAISDKNTATPTPNGMAIAIATTVATNHTKVRREPTDSNKY